MNNLSERQGAPKVSIGLPVRNGEAYLEEALESLATQDYPNLEIIVSDNGSTDATKEILAAAQARFPSIRVFTQTETLAATDNFTFVLEQAGGEFFCWAADDDVRAPGSIGRLAGKLENHPELVCVMSDVVNRYEGTGQRTLDLLEGIRLEKVLADWPSVRRLFFEVPTSNVFFCVYGLYRTEALRRVRMKMNLGFSANTEIPMLAQVALLGGIASIAEEDFIYRRHEQSIYHRETAAEEDGAPVRRRNVIRGVVAGIVKESSLEPGEKAAILKSLDDGRRVDLQAERERRAKVAERRKRKSRQKRKKPVGILARLRGRIRRLFHGSTATKKSAANGAGSSRPAGRVVADERMVRRKVDLENPKLRKLVQREEARRRLENRGWIFAGKKSTRIISERQITTLIDCGSNAGQYVDELKKTGWTGKVYSFEPLSDAYGKLRAKAESSEGWRSFQFALGEENGEATIQIAGNSYSSSLLQFSDEFKELRPDASPVGSETVTIRRLDDVVREERLDFEGPVMLKLDVQGFELSVLRGALETLPRVSLLQCELALIPSYEGGATFVEVREFLRERGFVLAHLIDGHANHETGELREVDGVFLNTRLVSPEA
jgi:FkbM family methyltransferase